MYFGVSFYYFSYKVTFNKLRVLKTEIEHLQHLLEKSRLQLQKDFELWWAEQAANLQVGVIKNKTLLYP